MGDYPQSMICAYYVVVVLIPELPSQDKLTNNIKNN